MHFAGSVASQASHPFGHFASCSSIMINPYLYSSHSPVSEHLVQPVGQAAHFPSKSG